MILIYNGYKKQLYEEYTQKKNRFPNLNPLVNIDVIKKPVMGYCVHFSIIKQKSKLILEEKNK